MHRVDLQMEAKLLGFAHVFSVSSKASLMMLPRVLIFMGVSGCGKTAVGEEVARRSGAHFVDADGLHPSENIAKMSAGIPLTDEDREPWLARVALEAKAPGRKVAACSALRRVYRDRIRREIPEAWFVFLNGSKDLIFSRISARKGHFMKAGLLDSQLATLEDPTLEDRVLVLPVTGTVKEIADAVFDYFSTHEGT